MADKTIPALDAASELDGSDNFAIDDGIQSYKVTIQQLLDKAFSYLKTQVNHVRNGDFAQSPGSEQDGQSGGMSLGGMWYAYHVSPTLTFGDILRLYPDTTDFPTPSEADGRSGLCLKIDANETAFFYSGTVFATSLSRVLYGIPGFEFLRLYGKACKLSFWVKSSRTGTFCVSFRNAGGYTLVKDFTVSAADTWEKKTIDVTFDETSGNDFTDEAGMIISFAIIAGSNFQTSNTNWTLETKYATGNISNEIWDDVEGEVFKLAQVTLNEGSTAAPFDSVHIIETPDYEP